MLPPRAAGSLFLLTGVSLLRLSALQPSEDTSQQLGSSLSRDGKEVHRLQPKPDAQDEDSVLFGDIDPQQLAHILVEALRSKNKVVREEGSVEEERDDGRPQEVDAERPDKDVEEERGDGQSQEVDAKRQDEDVEEEQDDERPQEVDAKRQDEDVEEEQGDGGPQEVEAKRQDEDVEEDLGDGRLQEVDAKRQDEDVEESTEDVMSRTIISTVEVQTKKPPTLQEEPKSGALSRLEEEEQLTEEELHSLETMMKEFPRVGAFNKRDDPSSFNEVIPVNKNLEQRLKWQEETQKGLNFPSFSFVDELQKMNSLVDGVPQGGDAEEMQQEEDSQEQMDEEVLSPEEEEARAKAEQEEMRRQAAEAQRARLEEEKLADIASDMLLRYMGKERGGQGKYRRPLSDAPEDKRSDEQPQDLDPQTIDKLIEISSKLHLPADDVVDIISDVEKKKRKDVVPETPAVAQSFSGPRRPWLHPKMAPSQDLWSKPRKLQPGPGLWSPKPSEGWLKPLVYPLPYYHRRPAYYPLPLPPPPRALPWYYSPRPYPLNRYLSAPVNSYAPSSRTYPAPVNWHLLRKPVPYYANSAPLWRFKLKAPPSRAAMQQKQWLAPVAAPAKEAKATDVSNRRDGLERYLKQLVLQKAHMLD